MKYSVSYMLFLCLVCFFSSSFEAQAQREKGKKEKEYEGIFYQIKTPKKERKKAQLLTDSSIIKLGIKMYNEQDFLIRNTYAEDFPLFLDFTQKSNEELPIAELLLQEGKVGDSLTLFVHTDSTTQNGHLRPMQSPEKGYVRMEMKVLKNLTPLDYKVELEQIKKDYLKRVEEERKKEQERKEQEKLQQKENQARSIESILEEEQKQFKKTSSGLFYVVEEQGTPVQKGEKIKVHYEGTLTNGNKFDSSFDRKTPFEFVVGRGQVIKGWDEGIPLIGKGGKGYLYIPSHLGYGERGAGGDIPPNAILVFRIEVME